MIETLIREAAERFGLGNNAKPFFTALLGLIFNQNSGGFSGFMQKFKDAGLGDLASSWVGGNPGDNVLQPDQVQAALGSDVLSSLAGKLGIPVSAVSMATAGVLPKLIGFLTPGGQIPNSIPASLGALLPGLGASGTGTAASAARDAGGGSWWKWLLPLLLLLGLLFWWRSCQRHDAVTPPAEPAVTTEPAAAPVVQSNARFGFENANGQVTVNGQVASDAEKTRLWDALKAAFGEANLSGDISVDPATLPAGWMDKLIAALPELKASGLKFGFDGDKLTIDTSALSEADRFALSDKLRGLFGGFEISGLWDRAAAALAGLKAGFSSADLVKALNLMNIYFDTGSATITRDSMETLTSAANAIKQLPAGTSIEVGGHTDNTGDAASNLALSQQRADAVVARLGELGVPAGTLTSKGYGQDKPRADNATEEGRAQNRRIEFTVLK